MENIKELLYEVVTKKSEEVPIAAALVSSSGEVLFVSRNKCEEINSLKHAELIVLNQALNERHSLKGFTLYVTLEPCLMCYGACLNSEVDKIVYYVRNKEDGAFSYFHADTQKHKIIIEYQEDNRFKDVLKQFFNKKR